MTWPGGFCKNVRSGCWRRWPPANGWGCCKCFLLPDPFTAVNARFPKKFGGRQICDVQNLAANATDLEKLADELAAYDVVIATEIGGGIVPIDPAERAAREAAGRLACLLAARASCVVEMFCGLPTVLKGELPKC